MVVQASTALIAKGNMKKFLTIILSVFFISSCIQNEINEMSSPKATGDEITATNFVRGSEDIPLVDGLELIDDENINFDSKSGSIASVDYKSGFDPEAVQAFYIRTLPQMGWKLSKNDQNHSLFTRDEEKLEIDFIESDDEGEDDLVRFAMSSITKN